MKYFKKFDEINENFGEYQPTPFDSPKLTSYTQQTPNGMAGSYDASQDTYKLDTPLENEFKKFSQNYSEEQGNKSRKKFMRKFSNKKVKHLKTK
jgi:hypothetical protein